MESNQEFIGPGPGTTSTHWSQLELAGDPKSPGYQQALDFLIRRYWKPVYSYLRKHGKSADDAADLTQEFFTRWLESDFIANADRNRGKFRALLLTSVKNFVKNQHRAARAQKRGGGKVVSIERLRDEEGVGFEPAHDDTPDQAFDRTWDWELALRVLRFFEQECKITGKEPHAHVFRKRIIEPAMTGKAPASREQLAVELQLTTKEVSNHDTTARRAYQRLLREEIRGYARSEEEVAEEVRRIFRLLSGE